MIGIKDFGMPSCCANCPCSKYEEVRWMEYKFIRCGVTLSKPDKSKNAFWDRESRLKDCPLVEAIPKDHITRAIDKVEEYICDVETDTVKAQGMAQALDIFDQVLGEIEDGNDSR